MAASTDLSQIIADLLGGTNKSGTNLTPEIVAWLNQQYDAAGPQGNQGIYNADLGMLQQPGGAPAWQFQNGGQNFNVNTEDGKRIFGRGVGNDSTDYFDEAGNFLRNEKDLGGNHYAGELAKLAATAALMYGGANGLNNMFGGEAALGGAGGDLTATELAQNGIFGGAGGGEFVAPELFAGSSPTGFSLSGIAESLGLPAAGAFGLAGPGTTLTGSALTNGLSGAASGTSFLDRAGNFLSDPANLLKTVGTVGALAEGLNGGEEGDYTATTTKTLDPRIDAAIFGADGKSGLFGDLMAWKNANPTGQNQTMIDAQNGMRGLLTDPRVLNGYMNMGGVGLGLLNTGVAPNPWKIPNGG